MSASRRDRAWLEAKPADAGVARAGEVSGRRRVERKELRGERRLVARQELGRRLRRSRQKAFPRRRGILRWSLHCERQPLDAFWTASGRRKVTRDLPPVSQRIRAAPAVVTLYQEQFHRDFSLFLELRSKELVLRGQMVLTILGREHQDPRTGELFTLYALLARALRSLVLEGRVEKEKLDTFNLPLYTPSVEEVTAAVERCGLFDVGHVQLFRSNWDPHDDSDDGDVVVDSARSGANVARVTRAVLEALLAPYFGEAVLDELFDVFARHVAAHLAKEKTKFTVIVLVLSLRARR